MILVAELLKRRHFNIFILHSSMHWCVVFCCTNLPLTLHFHQKIFTFRISRITVNIDYNSSLHKNVNGFGAVNRG